MKKTKCCDEGCLDKIKPPLQAKIKHFQDYAESFNKEGSFLILMLFAKRFFNIKGEPSLCDKAINTITGLSEKAINNLNRYIVEYPLTMAYCSPYALLQTGNEIAADVNCFLEKEFNTKNLSRCRLNVLKGQMKHIGDLYDRFDHEYPNTIPKFVFLSYLLQHVPLLKYYHDQSCTCDSCITCIILKRLLESEFNAETREDAETISIKHANQQCIIWNFNDIAIQLNDSLFKYRTYYSRYESTDEMVQVYNSLPLENYVKPNKKRDLYVLTQLNLGNSEITESSASEDSEELKKDEPDPSNEVSSQDNESQWEIRYRTSGKKMTELNMKNNFTRPLIIVPPQSPVPGSGLCIAMSADILCNLPQFPGSITGIMPMIGVVVCDYTQKKTNLYVYPALQGPKPTIDHYTSSLERHLNNCETLPRMNLYISVDDPTIFRSPHFISYISTIAIRGDYKPFIYCKQTHKNGVIKRMPEKKERTRSKEQPSTNANTPKVNATNSASKDDIPPSEKRKAGYGNIIDKLEQDKVLNFLSADYISENYPSNFVDLKGKCICPFVKYEEGQVQCARHIGYTPKDMKDDKDALQNFEQSEYYEYLDFHDFLQICYQKEKRAAELREMKQTKMVDNIECGKKSGMPNLKEDPQAMLEDEPSDYSDLYKRDYKDMDNSLLVSRYMNSLTTLPENIIQMRDILRPEEKEDIPEDIKGRFVVTSSLSCYVMLVSEKHVTNSEDVKVRSTPSFENYPKAEFYPAHLLRKLKAMLSMYTILDGFSLVDYCKQVRYFDKIIQSQLPKNTIATVENYVLQEDLEQLKMYLRKATFCYISPRQIPVSEEGRKNDLASTVSLDSTQGQSRDMKTIKMQLDQISDMPELPQQTPLLSVNNINGNIDEMKFGTNLGDNITLGMMERHEYQEPNILLVQKMETPSSVLDGQIHIPILQESSYKMSLMDTSRATQYPHTDTLEFDSKLDQLHCLIQSQEAAHVLASNDHQLELPIIDAKDYEYRQVKKYIKSFRLAMSICVAVSSLPFVPTDINTIERERPKGFIGMLDLIRVNKFSPIVTIPRIPLVGTNTLPMIRPHIPSTVLHFSVDQHSDIGWLSVLQDSMLKNIKNLIENYEIDCDTYSWWVITIMRFPIASENDDVKLIYNSDKQIPGPLSRYIVNVCNKLSIPNSNDIMKMVVDIAKMVHKKIRGAPL